MTKQRSRLLRRRSGSSWGSDRIRASNSVELQCQRRTNGLDSRRVQISRTQLRNRSSVRGWMNTQKLRQFIICIITIITIVTSATVKWET